MGDWLRFRMVNPTPQNPLMGDDLPAYEDRYADFSTLLQATRSRYRRARKLSRVGEAANDGGCFYAHDHNGIGCAIGCHLPNDLGRRMDHFGMSIQGFCQRQPSVVKDEYELELAAIRKELLAKFDVQAIGLENLTLLQKLHDRSENVKAFIASLDHLLELERSKSALLPHFP